MKLKYLSGGITPLFADYTPFEMPKNNTSLASSGLAAQPKETDENETDLSDLLDLLKDLDGLPNDAALIANYIKKLFKHSESAGSNLDSYDIANMYTKILTQLNTAKFNKKTYENAYQTVSDNAGLNELAITNTNKLVAMDHETGELTPVDLKDVKNLPENLLLLTNSNLLALRAQNPDLAFSNSILHIVENGIGIQKVLELIKNSIRTLGTDTVSQQGYTKLELQLFVNGIEFLQQAYQKCALAGIDISNSFDVEGLYKALILTESLARAAQQALDYVYTMLPDNAKTLLTLKAGDLKSAINTVFNFIMSGANSKIDFDAQMIQDKHGVDVGVGNDKKLKTSENDPVKSFVLGKGFKEPIKLNVGTGDSLYVNGRYSIIVNKLGEALGTNSTLEDVTGSAYAPILDMNNATFGGIKLNTNQSSKILLDSADIVGMDLPVDQEALQYGIIRPDLQMLERIELADTEIRTNKIEDPKKINAIYEKYNLPHKFNDEGFLDLLVYRRFARLSGIAEESALPEDLEVDSTVSLIDDDNLIDSVEETFKKKDKHYSISSGWFGNKDLYRGAIYIPVRENLVAASLGGAGNYLSLGSSDATAIERLWAQNEKLNTYLATPSLSELTQK